MGEQLQVSEPPYGLRHSYASLRIREDASIPELAEELGHSPHMTLTTYAHVINELRGTPPFTGHRGGRERAARGRPGGGEDRPYRGPRMTTNGILADHPSTIDVKPTRRNPALRAGSSAVRAVDS